MKVNARHTKEVTVELDDLTIREIILSKFYEIFDLREDVYLKDDKLMYDIEYYTSHSWYDEKVLRDATEEDKVALQVLKKLKENL